LTRASAKLLKSAVLYQGKVFRLQRDTVIEPGGVRAERDIIVHPGSVVVLPIFKDGRVLLIRQCRHSVGEFLWELVAGRKEPGEAPLAAARRELIEETGYTAKRLRKLLRVVPTPGFVNEWMWIFAAEELTKGAAQPEEDEKIVPRRFTLRQSVAPFSRSFAFASANISCSRLLFNYDSNFISGKNFSQIRVLRLKHERV